jgi:putative toxin-antitoxin system antitoxin component (TIGR02293 family)
MAMKARQSRSSADPRGHAEAGPIIRRANDPMTEADIAHAIMARCVAEEDGREKARVGKRRFRTPGQSQVRMPFCHKIWANGMRKPGPQIDRKPPAAPGLSEEARGYAADPPVVTAISSNRVLGVAAVRATPGALADLTRHGYSDEEIWSLVVPKRTLARRIAKNEPLTVEETDRALRLERIVALAGRVFGNSEKAHRWMRKPKHLLGGKTPVEFLASESGARQVEQMLYRIEHGIFA